MSSAHVFGQDQFLQCVSNCAPIVFVVDNEVSVRESLDLLYNLTTLGAKLLKQQHEGCLASRIG